MKMDLDRKEIRLYRGVALNEVSYNASLLYLKMTMKLDQTTSMSKMMKHFKSRAITWVDNWEKDSDMPREHSTVVIAGA